MKSLVSVLFASMLLCACSDEKPKQQPGKISDENVFSGQVRALEKAGGVEQTLQGDFDRKQQESSGY